MEKVGVRRSTDRSEQLRLLRSGDAVSWEELSTRMEQSMVSYAGRRLPAEEARDAVSESMARARDARGRGAQRAAQGAEAPACALRRRPGRGPRSLSCASACRCSTPRTARPPIRKRSTCSPTRRCSSSTARRATRRALRRRQAFVEHGGLYGTPSTYSAHSARVTAWPVAEQTSRTAPAGR